MGLTRAWAAATCANGRLITEGRAPRRQRLHALYVQRNDRGPHQRRPPLFHPQTRTRKPFNPLTTRPSTQATLPMSSFKTCRTSRHRCVSCMDIQGARSDLPLGHMLVGRMKVPVFASSHVERRTTASSCCPGTSTVHGKATPVLPPPKPRF